jgi:hypothetical protein
MNPYLRRNSGNEHAQGGSREYIPAPGRWVYPAAVLLLVVLFTPVAWAVPFSTDIQIQGSVEFDTGSALVTGNVTQTGDMEVISGGVGTTNGYNNTAVPAGDNPLTGNITDIGDGVGGTGTVSAQDESESKVGLDMLFNISNTSLTDSYKITFKVDLTKNSVDADGDNAFAESEFTVNDAGGEVFVSHLVSDTLYGDEKYLEEGGVVLIDDSLAPGGAELSQNNHVYLFDLVIDPGLAAIITAEWTGESEVVVVGGSANVMFDGFISVYDVENLSSPNPVPEPGTYLLIGLGLLGVGLMGRGRRKAA